MNSVGWHKCVVETGFYPNPSRFWISIADETWKDKPRGRWVIGHFYGNKLLDA